MKLSFRKLEEILKKDKDMCLFVVYMLGAYIFAMSSLSHEICYEKSELCWATVMYSIPILIILVVVCNCGMNFRCDLPLNDE